MKSRHELKSQPTVKDVCIWKLSAELATAALKSIRFNAVNADIRQLADEAINSLNDKDLARRAMDPK